MPPTTTIKSENQSQDTINATTTTTIHDSDDDQEDEQMTMLEGSQLIGGGGSSMSNHNPLSAFGKGNVNHLSSIASLNQIENDIAGLLDIGIKMFEDISMGTQQQQQQQQLHGSSDATAAAAAAVSSDLNKQFVTTVKKVAQELAAHIHRQSQQPTLPFESNSYSSFERLNNMMERSRTINDQL